MKYGWRFPILDGGKRQGINDSGIATFAGKDLYNNLAREICQNSLDAKDKDIDSPVIVSFNLKSINRDTFVPVKGLKMALESSYEYWKTFEDEKLNSFLDESLETLKKENLDFLIISDYNTTGLDGSGERKGAWDALTGSNGVSYKTNGSQGSFGIGKNAPYACSKLRTVFYNTYSKKDLKKAFQGVTSLVTHKNAKDEETQGCGFYYNLNDKKPIYDVDSCTEASYFRRTDFGTDIIIMGFKKSSQWKEDIKLAIIKNFFIAIINKKLVVNIDEDIKINDSTIMYHIAKAVKEYPSDREIVKVNNYCSAYNDADEVFNCSILEDNDIQLYVKIDNSYTRSCAYLRSTGMLINRKQIKKMKPYEAVLIVTGDKMNEMLKLMEPPKHDKWDPNLLSEQLIKQGRKNKKLMDNFVLDSIESICKIETVEEIDPDGVSSFLPDDTDFINNDSKGNSQTELEANLVIENVKKDKPFSSVSDSNGKSGEGDADDDGEVHNDSDSEQKWDTNIPKPGEFGDGQDKIIDVDPNGQKHIVKEVKARYRAIPIKYDIGLYNFIFTPDRDYSKAQFSFKSVGEDGSKDAIKVLGYDNNGKYEKLDLPYFEIKDIKANIKYSFTIKINSDERVLLSVGGLGYESER